MIWERSAGARAGNPSVWSRRNSIRLDHGTDLSFCIFLHLNELFLLLGLKDTARLEFLDRWAERSAGLSAVAVCCSMKQG